jgi:hypothetical protein
MSVEYEAEDLYEPIDDDIREARRVGAELRINSRRKELQLNSKKGVLFFLEALRVPTRARRVLAPAGSKVRELPEGAKGAGSCQKGLDHVKKSWIMPKRAGSCQKKVSGAAEPSLNGVSTCMSYTESRRSLSKDLLEDYAEALKMWPSRPKGRVKFQKNDKLRVSEDQKRAIEIADCLQFSKRFEGT